jgi:hypothetical protein
MGRVPNFLVGITGHIMNPLRKEIPMPIPAIVYAGAYVGGTLAGTAIGTTIAKKLLPTTRSYNTGPTTYFDLSKELDRLGMKNPF